MRNTIIWQSIETNLDNMKPVEGGFSQARRGLIDVPSSGRVFVKIGTDDNSREWARKEVAVYQYLKRQSYEAVPELLVSNADNTAFALEALTAEGGWDWSETWTSERLAATLEAMDKLATLKPQGEDWLDMGQLTLDESRDGWAALRKSADQQQALLSKLELSGKKEVANALDISESQADRLDSDALQWLAGFWFSAAATPIWPGGPGHLCDFQLQADVMALDLARKV